MIDMTMSDEYRVDLTEKIASIPEQMDTWLPGIDQQMLTPHEQETTCKKPITRGNPRAGTKKTDGGHRQKVSPARLKASQINAPCSSACHEPPAPWELLVKKPLFSFDSTVPFS
jgi:hypothetical protein